ncbi:hypothetical protein JHK85_015502 [Glycine max]|nr:hypothetical protein JHK85_015502 [Glycine max]KAG5045739.1 hypothetical protein JHK86_015145 [Glycine max]
MAEVVTSAPGKVLMTGGYLILERPNPGLVLSTNARFYAIIKPIHHEIKPDSWAWVRIFFFFFFFSLFILSSFTHSFSLIEFPSGMDRYQINLSSALQTSPLQTRSQKSRHPNLIREILLWNMRFSIPWLLLMQRLDITILGGNDFYSYRNEIERRGLPLTPESLATLLPFSSITFNTDDADGGSCKPEVAKTGLGSSAAMTTAVVAALLHYLDVVKLSSSKDHWERKDVADLDMVHKIAQTAHCIAQGKVGSGFDVSSAVYGSQRYVRFSPEVISSTKVGDIAVPLPDSITEIIKGNWDHDTAEFSLPPLMTLLLGEPGTGGSSTPSMVGAVKKWQKSDPQKSLDTWRRLSEANSALEMQLNLLSKLAKEQWNAYKSVIDSCSMLRSDKWIEQASEPNKEAIIKALLGAKEAMLGIRYRMSQMGEAAGVPIEPESQTQLLDATVNLEGVLLAGVPGAGGFDAVFAVTLGDSSSNVTKIWSSLNVLALLVKEDPCGVCLEKADPRTNEITSAVSSIHIQ